MDDFQKQKDELTEKVKLKMEKKAREGLLRLIVEVSAEADVMILQALGVDAKEFLLNTIKTECDKLSKE